MSDTKMQTEDDNARVEKACPKLVELEVSKRRTKWMKRSASMTEDELKEERRAANRLSALHSRRRKTAIIDELKKTVAHLYKQNADHKQANHELRNAMKTLRQENEAMSKQLEQLGVAVPRRKTPEVANSPAPMLTDSDESKEEEYANQKMSGTWDKDSQDSRQEAPQDEEMDSSDQSTQQFTRSETSDPLVAVVKAVATSGVPEKEQPAEAESQTAAPNSTPEETTPPPDKKGSTPAPGSADAGDANLRILALVHQLFQAQQANVKESSVPKSLDMFNYLQGQTPGGSNDVQSVLMRTILGQLQQQGSQASDLSYNPAANPALNQFQPGDGQHAAHSVPQTTSASQLPPSLFLGVQGQPRVSSTSPSAQQAFMQQLLQSYQPAGSSQPGCLNGAPGFPGMTAQGLNALRNLSASSQAQPETASYSLNRSNANSATDNRAEANLQVAKPMPTGQITEQQGTSQTGPGDINQLLQLVALMQKANEGGELRR